MPKSLTQPVLEPELVGVTRRAIVDRAEHLHLRLQTPSETGEIECRLHPGSETEGAAVMWVLGPAIGLHGPVEAMYERLWMPLCADGITSFGLSYRRPGHLTDSVADVFAGIAYLRQRGWHRIVLVGHGFGGAVAINVAAQCAPDSVVAVAALSSQTYRTEPVDRIAPRPLLLMHGMADNVLPASGSRDLYNRAGEPKQLLLYPGCGHSFEQCQSTIAEDLSAWLGRCLGDSSAAI